MVISNMVCDDFSSESKHLERQLRDADNGDFPKVNRDVSWMLYVSNGMECGIRLIVSCSRK